MADTAIGRLAVHRVGAYWLALQRERFDAEAPPERLELTPGPRSPVVWSYKSGTESGRLLNVQGWLEGGLVPVSTAGRLYLRKAGTGTLALYLPGAPLHLDLSAKAPKALDAAGRKQPLYPDTWPPGAVRQVIRRRLRTLIVLNEDALLAEAQGPDVPQPGAATAQDVPTGG